MSESIYDVIYDMTPRPDNPGNSPQCIAARKKFERHAAKHFVYLLDFFLRARTNLREREIILRKVKEVDP